MEITRTVRQSRWHLNGDKPGSFWRYRSWVSRNNSERWGGSSTTRWQPDRRTQARPSVSPWHQSVWEPVQEKIGSRRGIKERRGRWVVYHCYYRHRLLSPDDNTAATCSGYLAILSLFLSLALAFFLFSFPPDSRLFLRLALFSHFPFYSIRTTSILVSDKSFKLRRWWCCFLSSLPLQLDPYIANRFNTPKYDRLRESGRRMPFDGLSLEAKCFFFSTR